MLQRAVSCRFSMVVRTTLCFVFLAACGSVAEGQGYEIIDLDPAHSGGRAYAVNNLGQVVGESLGRATMFDTTGGGANINLGGPGDDASRAYDISENGTVVGWVRGADSWEAAVFDASESAEPITLGGLPGYSKSMARAVNDSGGIAGYSWHEPSVGLDYDFRATVFVPGGSNINLGTSGYFDSSAFDINSDGVVVGGVGHSFATVFDSSGSGANTDISGDDNYYSRALGINANGEVVGYAEDPDRGRGSDYAVATRFDPSGQGNNVNLGALNETYALSQATAINDDGVIVGFAHPQNWPASFTAYCRAVLFDRSGGGANIRLDRAIPAASGWELEKANDINNNGVIVGEGDKGAFLLRPKTTLPPVTLASTHVITAAVYTYWYDEDAGVDNQAHDEESSTGSSVTAIAPNGEQPSDIAEAAIDVYSHDGHAIDVLSRFDIGWADSASVSFDGDIAIGTAAGYPVGALLPLNLSIAAPAGGFEADLLRGDEVIGSLEGGNTSVECGVLAGENVRLQFHQVNAGAGLTVKALSAPTANDVAAGANQTAQARGGSDYVAGVDFSFSEVITPGTLNVDFTTMSVFDLPPAFVDPAEFPPASDPVQMWAIDFSGDLDGLMELTFCYDDTNLLVPEADLGMCHYVEGAGLEWLPVVARDFDNNTITVTTTSFSDFALAPEPATLALLTLGGLGLLARRKKRA